MSAILEKALNLRSQNKVKFHYKLNMRKNNFLSLIKVVKPKRRDFKTTKQEDSSFLTEEMPLPSTQACNTTGLRYTPYKEGETSNFFKSPASL